MMIPGRCFQGKGVDHWLLMDFRHLRLRSSGKPNNTLTNREQSHELILELNIPDPETSPSKRHTNNHMVYPEVEERDADKCVSFLLKNRIKNKQS